MPGDIDLVSRYKWKIRTDFNGENASEDNESLDGLSTTVSVFFFGVGQIHIRQR